MAKRKKNNGDERKKKILGILLIFFAVLLLVSLLTHADWDDEQIQIADNPFGINFINQVGIVGAFSSYILFFFFGWLALFIPLFIIWGSLFLFGLEFRKKAAPALLTVFPICIMGTMITDVYLIESSDYTLNYTGANGGYIFYHFALFLIKLVGITGSYLILAGGILTGLFYLVYSYESLASILRLRERLAVGRIFGPVGRSIKAVFTKFGDMFQPDDEEFEPSGDEYDNVVRPEPDSSGEREELEEKPTRERQKRKLAKKQVSKSKPAVKSAPIGVSTTDYNFPNLDLLADNPESGTAVSTDELNFTAKALKDTLETFDISIQGSIDKYPGPVITRYEFKPAAGVKVNRIIGLSDDLALALSAKRIRIVAPIPGKSAVGIEIPNRKARLVYLKEIINSDVYSDSRLKLPLALGKTIAGRPYVADLAKMPHLLIAGATGSGKSVCINGVITSLLYRMHPKDLKFIFIDPKMLELSVYAGIPHLGRPVVTNSKRAEKVLSDAVVEMEKRYKKLASVAVRSIGDYNAKVKDPEEKMPYIVIIVDELADMMIAAASSRIEMLITRLAQMARAVGIHLILATQRPSVDVITGLIKANFSARIGFQVATKIDSRTILDANGAEKLLGNGDMLFLPPGHPEPIRLHGAFISSEETEKLVKFILDQFPELEKAREEKKNGKEEEESPEDAMDLDDPLFIEAAQTVVRHKQGSVSLLQRKLGIGYQRAARLIDKLEESKIVGPYDGSKARDVLVDKAFIQEMLESRSLTGRNS